MDPLTVRHPTPPGSVITVHLPSEAAADDHGFPFAVELHRQTGLPVVVVDAQADLSVTTPQEAEAVLRRLMEYRTGEDSADLARILIPDLAEQGWLLVQVRDTE